MSQRTNTKQQVKPFCKVCFDAGKSEVEYTSHFVKSEPGLKGIVVCPTLLSQPCTYCYTKGHTVSYCTVLKKDKKLKADQARSARARQFVDETAKKPVNKNRSNVFNMLVEESDDEEECAPVVKPVEEYPSLTSANKARSSTVAPTMPHSYAAMAATAATAATATATAAVAIAVPIEAAKQTMVARKIVVERRSWADWTDSDDDEDDDE
uniref:Nanos-type domain-containing protein n=1 Tax=viral metagenome TaxID=1070528 RepID=A0A6C0LJG8_9ZZZZ